MKQEHFWILVQQFSKNELNSILDTADALGIKYVPGWAHNVRIITFPTIELDSKEWEAFIELTGIPV